MFEDRLVKKLVISNSQKFRTNIWLVIQVTLFDVLYAVWILPNTILVRNLCLVIGALIGISQIYRYRNTFDLKRILPLTLLVGLFFWATLHILFLSNNFVMQYEEYMSVWKRSLLALIFGLGFALAIAHSSSNLRKTLWIIFYIGLLAPILIYLLKYLLGLIGLSYRIHIPEYWHIYKESIPPSPYYIAKTAYMGFCAPTLAVTLGQLYARLKRGEWFSWCNLFYVISLAAIFFIFYKENVKNGILYGFIFVLIFLMLISLKTLKTAPIKNGLLILCALVLSGIFITKHIHDNRSWQTLYADAKIAVQTERYQNWKYGNDMGYPTNEYGETVSVTNYERIAWFISASKLVLEYPLGYGLIERSFRQRGNQLWPGSHLSQSHSGWLDLTLGVGLPGLLLVLGSLVASLIMLVKIKLSDGKDYSAEPWMIMATSTLLCFLLIWCTTEISQKVFFEELIFFLAFAAGLVIGSGNSDQKNKSLRELF